MDNVVGLVWLTGFVIVILSMLIFKPNILWSIILAVGVGMVSAVVEKGVVQWLN